MSSWRVKLFGLVSGLSAILNEVANELDSDPTTHLNYGLILAAITGIIAAFNARDNRVTSEQAGAKR